MFLQEIFEAGCDRKAGLPGKLGSRAEKTTVEITSEIRARVSSELIRSLSARAD